MNKELQLKEYKYYIGNILSYLYELWQDEYTHNEIIERLKTLFGFTNADLSDFGLEVEENG